MKISYGLFLMGFFCRKQSDLVSIYYPKGCCQSLPSLSGTVRHLVNGRITTESSQSIALNQRISQNNLLLNFSMIHHNNLKLALSQLMKNILFFKK